MLCRNEWNVTPRGFKDSYVIDNNLRNNDVGIYAVGGSNRIEGNHVTDGGTGVKVDGTTNVIIKNSAQGYRAPYEIVPGNDVGPIGTAASSTSPWANIAL